MMPAARLTPPLVTRVGARVVCVTGLLLVAAGLFIISRIGTDTSYWLMLAGLVPLGVGMGAAMICTHCGRIRFPGWSLGAALHYRKQFLVWTCADRPTAAVVIKEGQGNLAIRALADQVVNYLDVLGGGCRGRLCSRPHLHYQPVQLALELFKPHPLAVCKLSWTPD